jgi:ribosomal protein L1
MAAFEHLLSQAHRHCFRKTSFTLSSYLRSHSIPLFHRSLCSSPPSPSPQPVPESNPESQPADYSRRSPKIELKPVSYPVKTTAEPPPEQNPSRSPLHLPQGRTWTREEARYVKDTPSFSPISYPKRVAPLPEYTKTLDATIGDAAKEEAQPENEQLDRETRRMEADRTLFRRGPRVEDEKIPFPTLIKTTNTKKDKAVYDLKEAIQLIQTNAKRNFDETLEAHVKLTPDLRRTDLKLTGSALLPHGTGKAVRVAVFAEGPAADEAKTAGADVVGGEELIEGIKNGTVKVDFDKCIATPQIMARVSKTISKTLRRLTPNAKEGTVTNDISRVVREAKQNIMFRKDKSAIVHVGLGKVSFGEEALRENVGAFVHALLLAKPAGLKKSSKYAGYVSTFHLCSTMGPSYPVTIQSLSIAAERFNKLQVR